jgi:hypothetical protein
MKTFTGSRINPSNAHHMRNALLLLFLSWLVSSVSAQITLAKSAKLTWGDTERTKNSPDQYVGTDAKGNLIFFGTRPISNGALFGGGSVGTEYILLVYTKALEYKDVVEIEVPDLKEDGYTYSSLKNVGSVVCVSLAQNSYVIGSVPTDDGLAFYAWRIDVQKKKLLDARKIGTMSGVKSLRAGLKWDKSPSDQLGLLSASFEQKRQDKEYVYTLLVDEQMRQRTQMIVEIPYERQDFNFGDISLDDAGKIIITGEVRIDKTERKDRKLKYEPVLLSFEKSSKLQQVNLQLGQKRVQSLKNFFNTAGKGLAIGFYGNTRYDEQDGLFFATIDSLGQLQAPVTHEFETDFLVADLTKKQQEKAKRRMKNSDRDYSESNYLMREVNLLSDGSFLAIAEQYEMVVIQNQNMNNAQGRMQRDMSVIEYHYGNLIVAKLSDNGSLLWVKKVPRSSVANRSSEYFERKFAKCIQNDTLYLLYEDLSEGKRRKKIDVICTVTRDGSIKEELLELDVKLGNIRFGEEQQISPSELLLVRDTGLWARRRTVGVLKIN